MPPIQDILISAGFWDYLPIVTRKKILGDQAPEKLPKPTDDPWRGYSAKAALMVLELGLSYKTDASSWPEKIKQVSFPKLWDMGGALLHLLNMNLGEDEAAVYADLFDEDTGAIATSFNAAGVAAIFLGLLYVHAPEGTGIFLNGGDQLNEMLDTIDALTKIGSSELTPLTKKLVASEVFRLQARTPNLVLSYLELIFWADHKQFPGQLLADVLHVFGYVDAALARTALEHLIFSGIVADKVLAFFRTLQAIAGLPLEEKISWIHELEQSLLGHLGQPWKKGNGHSPLVALVQAAETDMEAFAARFAAAGGAAHSVTQLPQGTRIAPRKLSHVSEAIDILPTHHFKRVIVVPERAKGWAQKYVELLWAYRRGQFAQHYEEGQPIFVGSIFLDFVPGTISGMRSIVVQQGSEILWELHPDGSMAIHATRGLSDLSFAKIDEALDTALQLFTESADRAIADYAADPSWDAVRLARQHHTHDWSGIAGYSPEQVLEDLHGDRAANLPLLSAYLDTGIMSQASRQAGFSSYDSAKGNLHCARTKWQKIMLGLNREEERAKKRAGEKHARFSARRPDRFMPEPIDARRFMGNLLPRPVKARLALGALTNSFVPLSRKELEALSPTEQKVVNPLLQGFDFKEIAEQIGMEPHLVQNHFVAARRGITVMRRPQTRYQWRQFFREFITLEYSGVLGFKVDDFALLIKKLAADYKDLIELLLAGHTAHEATAIYDAGHERRGKDVITLLKDHTRDLVVSSLLPIADLQVVYDRARYLRTLKPVTELDFLPPRCLEIVRLMGEKGITDLHDIAGRLEVPYASVWTYIRKIREGVAHHLGSQGHEIQTASAQRALLAGTAMMSDGALFDELVGLLPADFQRALKTYLSGIGGPKAAAQLKLPRGTYEGQVLSSILAMRLKVANGEPLIANSSAFEGVISDHASVGVVVSANTMVLGPEFVLPIVAEADTSFGDMETDQSGDDGLVSGELPTGLLSSGLVHAVAPVSGTVISGAARSVLFRK